MKKLCTTFFFAVCMLTVMFTGTAFADPACNGWNYYDADSEECVACGTNGFTITTTSLPENTEFWFSMSPKGSFAVDWGGEIQNIDRDNTTATPYTHTYTTSGVKTIKFCGKATEYNSSAGDSVVAAITFYKSFDAQGSQIRIASVSGSLGSVFPTLGNDPDQQPRFRSTFQGASNLTTIPATLFNGVSGSADGMFRSTFDKCTLLSAIPYGLFANATGGAQNMFRSTFYQCTSLTSLPDDLFAEITVAANNEFMYTLYGTTGLAGKYIPPTAFTGLVNNNSPQNSTMWNKTFDTSGLVIECPTRTHQFFTGYEGTTAGNTWAGHVSCEPNNSCTGAEYWDSNTNQCVPCPTGYTYDITDAKESINECKIQCAGGTYLANANDTTCSDAGAAYYAPASIVAYGSTSNRSPCPTGYTYNTSVNKTSINQCKIRCAAGTYLANVNDTTCSNVGAAYYSSASVVAYGSTSSRSSCPTGYTYDASVNKTSINQCKIHCDAGTYLATANDPSCSNVGDGWWAVASTVAYGETSTRTQCPDGEMTGTLNAHSSSQCIELCTGATYHDSGTNTCVPCPIGYNANTLSGKTAASECQILCNAGTYVAQAGDTMCSNVGDGYYAAASMVNYGSAGSKLQCPNGQLTGTQTATNQSQCKTSCQGATYYDSVADDCLACPIGFTDNTTNGKNSITQCQHHCNAGTYTETYTPIAYLQSRNGNQFIDTRYEVTSTHVNGTAVVGTPTTMSGSGSDSGNFFGNVYGPGGFSSNYKKGVFGLWMQPKKGSGKKAEFSATFTADTQYTITYDVSVSGNKVKAKLRVNGGTEKTNELSNTAFNDAGNTFKLFTNGGSIKEGNTINILWGDKLFTGRIYSLQLYDGGTLVLDLIPVRRESDGALGMYNQLNHEFYGNAGLGTFIAGADNGNSFTVCSPVGNGYYVTANDTNYGSNGIRNACPNGSSTVANNEIINNATSIYQCEGIVPCTGPTYPDPNTGICTSCPTGYDYNRQNDKETIEECQIHCDGGTYLATAYNATCSNVGDGYYADATNINWGDIGTRTRCQNGGVTNTETAIDEQECVVITDCTGATYMNFGVCVSCPPGYDADTSSGKISASECQIHCNAGTYIASAGDTMCTNVGDGYYAAASNVNYGSIGTRGQCPNGQLTGTQTAANQSQCLASCQGATYLNSTTGQCDSCPTGYDADTTIGKDSASDCKISCPEGTYLATANDTTCTDAGTGYWAAGGAVNYGSTSTRTQCATGLTTVGYGHGADEASDCGRKLHVGNYVIYTKTTKTTIPAINVQVENDATTHYIGVSDTDQTLTPIHVTQGNTQYTAFDDSILYGERDLETNTRITQ